MVHSLWLAAVALLLDKFIGDPSWIPHPVMYMGNWIKWWESRLNRTNWKQTVPKRFLGGLLVVITVGLFGGSTWFALRLIGQHAPLFAFLIQLWLIATTIAWKGLVLAGRKVANELGHYNLMGARAAVAEIVGRDTDTLTESEVIRAAVETLAENLVDAVVAPVLFAALGGAPLALAYRAVNTLDSMVGHKNERFCHFGWASAHCDDVMNYIPARITAVLLYVAVILVKGDARKGWHTFKRDAKKHPSPNSGIPEAFVAGALGVQLGGVNYYAGRPSMRPCLGMAYRELEHRDILRTIRFVNVSTWFLLFFLVLVASTLWLL